VNAPANLIDRLMQRRILEFLAELSPYPASPEDGKFNGRSMHTLRQFWYLDQHGLIKGTFGPGQYESALRCWEASITAKGLDFLANDGGLSAVLNVLTVRFDADTLKALLSKRINESQLPVEKKAGLLSWLRSAGEEALKSATTRLIDAALDKAPEALEAICDVVG